VKLRVGVDARKLTDFGIGTYLKNLVRGLAARNDVELTLFVRGGHEERARSLAPGAGVVTVAAGGYTLGEQVALPLALWRRRLDLIHVPHYVVPVLARTPIVTTVHDVIQLYYPPRRRTQLGLFYLRLMMGLALRRSRRVITVSRASRRDLLHLFRAPADKVAVVPNGVDAGLAERPDEAVIRSLRRDLDLKPPLILVVANDKPHKNLGMALRAFHLAVRRHQIPGQLVIVGGVPPDGELARRAVHLGLADRVRFPGRLPWDKLATLYHAASVLLHVALYEGFGLPILEAMCAGLPVVTSNLGAMRELGEGAARLVNPLDVQEIAGALETVLVDDPLRRRMVEAGRRKAAALSWENTVEKTMTVYRQAQGEVLS